jgi:hypothetical protein
MNPVTLALLLTVQVKLQRIRASLDAMRGDREADRRWWNELERDMARLRASENAQEPAQAARRGPG